MKTLEEIEKSLAVMMVEKAINKGELPEDILTKAKYIRREGSPGNYTYIYKEGEGPGSSKQQPKREEKKTSGTHISDMKGSQKLEAAKKLGIKDPEKLSPKELDKQLTEKNVEKQMKEFKVKKELKVHNEALNEFYKEKDPSAAIHENSKEIAKFSGISEKEFKNLNPKTKLELLNNYKKELSKKILDLSKHSDKELNDAKMIRLKNGKSENDPEVKQITMEQKKRESSTKEPEKKEDSKKIDFTKKIGELVQFDTKYTKPGEQNKFGKLIKIEGDRAFVKQPGKDIPMIVTSVSSLGLPPKIEYKN